MRDLLNNSTQAWLLSAKQRNDDTTGTSVDLKGEGRKILVAVSVGATATATLSIVIEESVDNSTFTTLHAFADFTNPEARVVDLTPTKRYVRAVGTLSETGAVAVDYGVLAVVYNERYRPSNVA